MSRFVVRNFALLTGALALSVSVAIAKEGAAKKIHYTPADPNHYPFHGIIEKNGKKINIDGAVMSVEAPIKIKKGQLKYGKSATDKEIRDEPFGCYCFISYV